MTTDLGLSSLQWGRFRSLPGTRISPSMTQQRSTPRKHDLWGDIHLQERWWYHEKSSDCCSFKTSRHHIYIYIYIYVCICKCICIYYYIILYNYIPLSLSPSIYFIIIFHDFQTKDSELRDTRQCHLAMELQITVNVASAWRSSSAFIASNPPPWHKEGAPWNVEAKKLVAWLKDAEHIKHTPLQTKEDVIYNIL